MEGELTVTSTSPDSLAFTTTSTWDRSIIYWSHPGELFATWYCESPSSVQAFALPRIPEYIADLFPDYPRTGFELRHVEIIQDATADMVLSQGKYFGLAGSMNASNDIMTARPDGLIRPGPGHWRAAGGR